MAMMHNSAPCKPRNKFFVNFWNHFSFQKSSELPDARQGEVDTKARAKAAAWAWYQRGGGTSAEIRDGKAISRNAVTNKPKSRFNAEAQTKDSCNDSSSKSPLQSRSASLYDDFEIRTLQKHVAKLTQSIPEEASANRAPANRARSPSTSERNTSDRRFFSDMSCPRQVLQQPSEKVHPQRFVDGGKSVVDEKVTPKSTKSSLRRPFSSLQKFVQSIVRVNSSKHSQGYRHGENHYHYYHHHHFYYHHGPDRGTLRSANEDESSCHYYHHHPDEDTRSPESELPRRRHSANFYEHSDEAMRSPESELPRRRRHSVEVLYGSSQLPEGPQVQRRSDSANLQDRYSVQQKSPPLSWNRRHSDRFCRYSEREPEDCDKVSPLYYAPVERGQYGVHKSPQISRSRRHSDSFSRSYTSGQEYISEDYEMNVLPLPMTYFAQVEKDQFPVLQGPRISRRRRHSESFSRSYGGQESMPKDHETVLPRPKTHFAQLETSVLR